MHKSNIKIDNFVAHRSSKRLVSSETKTILAICHAMSWTK